MIIELAMVSWHDSKDPDNKRKQIEIHSN
jgi:hypothetical protein